mmetsp:Transcript_30094/g.96062  ORF Transcript_30094/g.96062 Transcript_30094/m.96062 type:complete len:229 (-) Transcript_30094:346-1032(-)
MSSLGRRMTNSSAASAAARRMSAAALRLRSARSRRMGVGTWRQAASFIWLHRRFRSFRCASCRSVASSLRRSKARWQRRATFAASFTESCVISGSLESRWMLSMTSLTMLRTATRWASCSKLPSSKAPSTSESACTSPHSLAGRPDCSSSAVLSAAAMTIDAGQRKMASVRTVSSTATFSARAMTSCHAASVSSVAGALRCAEPWTRRCCSSCASILSAVSGLGSTRS